MREGREGGKEGEREGGREGESEGGEGEGEGEGEREREINVTCGCVMPVYAQICEYKLHVVLCVDVCLSHLAKPWLVCSPTHPLSQCLIFLIDVLVHSDPSSVVVWRRMVHFETVSFHLLVHLRQNNMNLERGREGGREKREGGREGGREKREGGDATAQLHHNELKIAH